MLVAALLGIAIGMIASTLGIGGGALLVPLLHVLLGLEVHKAIGTSLFVIVFISSLAAAAYSREGLVMWRLALIFEIGSSIGAYVGATISSLVPSLYLKVAFSSLLFYLSYRMWRGNGRNSLDDTEGQERELITQRFLGPILGFGLLAGFLSGLLGIGGGILKVPIMRLIFGLPMHNAVATSALMISITTLVGALTHASIGNVELTTGSLLVPFTILGSYLGTKVSVRLRSRSLSRIFSVLLVFVAIRMAISS